MAKSRFMLSRLIVTGDSKEPATIQFSPGLNVIGGPSDTGKTYLFESINYAFGAKVAPDAVPESIGYHTVNIELKADKELFTLRRRFDDSKISLFRCAFDSISDSTHVEFLSAKHSPDSSDNISAFLLQLTGMGNAVHISINKDDETKSLSFRNLWHFVAVDEMEILTKNSPITTDQHTQKTTYRSIFDYLLTGKAAEKKPKPTVRTQVADARQDGQLELYAHMIANLENQIANIEEERARFGPVHEIELRISQLTDQLIKRGKHIADFMESRNKLIDEMESIRERVISIDNMRRRFELLRQHYGSDLSRLDFISQGQILLAQLQSSNCPTCGHELDSEDHEHSDNQELDVSIQVSCTQEALKIRNHLTDLEKTFNRLADEGQILEKKDSDLNLRLETMEHSLQTELRPGWLADKRQLESLSAYQRTVGEYQASFNQLSALRVAYGQLRKTVSEEEQAEQDLPETMEPTVEADNDLSSFTVEIQHLLAAWYFTNETISFDSSAADIVVGTKARRAFGKGKRAVLYSAFLIGLLNYCFHHKKPHPGFAILDSPLTTHVQDTFVEDEDDEVSEEIQQAFFTSLAQTAKDRQIIILDNKLPPSDLNINFIHFQGPGHKGRIGFFPI